MDNSMDIVTLDAVTPVYFSVDTEFTDGDLRNGHMLQLGIVCVDTDDELGIDLLLDERPVVPNEWVARNLPGLVVQCMQSTAFTPPDQRLGSLINQASEVISFIRANQSDVARKALHIEPSDWFGRPAMERALTPAQIIEQFPAVFVGYGGSYDFGFVELFFRRAGIMPFHYDTIDIGSLAMGLFPSTLSWGFSSRQLTELLGLPGNDNPHDALSDARHQAKIFAALMKRRSVAPEAR